MKSEAWARSSARRMSCSLASGRPTRRFSEICRANSIGSWNTTPILRRRRGQRHRPDVLAVHEDAPRLRVEGPVQQAERRRFARARRAHQRHRLARPHLERHVGHGGALAVVGEADALEHHFADGPAQVRRARHVPHRGHGIDDVEELAQLRRIRKTVLVKLTACSMRATSMVARLMKATISPTVAWPCRFSQVPSRNTPRIVSVAEARVATAASAHQDRTGICAAEQLVPDAAQSPRFQLDAREALDDGHVPEGIGRMLGQVELYRSTDPAASLSGAARGSSAR